MGISTKSSSISGFLLYWRLLRIQLLSGFQYKGWIFMMFQVCFGTVTDPIATILLFSRFGSIGAWTFERIILMYAMAVTSFGLAETFCRGYDSFPFRMVRDGGFDRVLLRPRSVFVQVAASEFHIHRVARVASGLVAVCWSLWRLEVPLLRPASLLLLAGAALGGFLTYVGAFVLTAGLSIFTVKAIDWIYIFTNASYQVTRCPLEYMPSLLRRTFTFFIPILVISYYPASALCGWGEPLWKGLLALPAGVAFLLFAQGIWSISVRRYCGTGS